MTESPYRDGGAPEEEPRETAAPPGGAHRGPTPDYPIDDAVQDKADQPPTADPTAEPAGEQAGEQAEGSDPAGDELALTRMELAERLADLQRLQAEFLNYKRRVDRDRDLVRENATYAALSPITEVLDTIDRAREHAPLEGGFKAVADQLERIVSGLGLTKFGAPGDAFDPTIHEALSHLGEDPDVAVTTCKVVAKAGYRIGERVVRAAQVLVVDPVPGGPTPPQPEHPEQQAEQPAEADASAGGPE